MQIPNHVKEHIETIAKQEQEFLSDRTGAERLADSIAKFAGSFRFVLVHLVFFSAWIATNLGKLGCGTFRSFPYLCWTRLLRLRRSSWQASS
jgi:uncharacterized membrane protein